MPKTLNTDLLNWMPAIRSLVGEASTLGLNGEPAVMIRSKKTDRDVLFKLTEVRKDAEGDITSWDYTPTEAVSVDTLMVFND